MQITESDLPFGEFGNSHKYYKKNPGLVHSKYRDLYLKKTQRDFGVLRTCWPLNVGVKLINFNEELNFYYQQCKTDLDSLADTCDKILIIYPTENSKVWWYQNYCEKTLIEQHVIDTAAANKDEFWRTCPWATLYDPVVRARYHLDFQLYRFQPGLKEVYSKFNKTTAIDFETWQLRYAMAWDLHSCGTEYYQCWDRIFQDFDWIKCVSLEQLRDQFNSTVHEILDYFEIDSEIVHSLDYIESEWSQRQEHQFKDSIVTQIVTAIINAQPMDWADARLNLFDEVYIEKILHYEHGIELLPANIWPTTTEEFLKLLK